jgi:hypothetical protein
MQKTSILDPMSAMASEDETLEAHRPTIKRLHAALANCLELFFFRRMAEMEYLCG